MRKSLIKQVPPSHPLYYRLDSAELLSLANQSACLVSSKRNQRRLFFSPGPKNLKTRTHPTSPTEKNLFHHRLSFLKECQLILTLASSNNNKKKKKLIAFYNIERVHIGSKIEERSPNPPGSLLTRHLLVFVCFSSFLI